MTTEEYIKERMKEFAKNIDEIFIGQIVKDSESGMDAKVTNKNKFC